MNDFREFSGACSTPLMLHRSPEPPEKADSELIACSLSGYQAFFLPCLRQNKQDADLWAKAEYYSWPIIV